MQAKGINPILNVSDISASIAWFEKLGWNKAWEWGSPVGFGCVCSGVCEIFLCLDGQGGRGKSDKTTTFGTPGADAADHGVWMSVWVDSVDDIYQHCLNEGLEVTCAPADMLWESREMHVRHPDGHVFRISSAIEANSDTLVK